MLPISVASLANGAVMVFTPTQVCKLGCLYCRTAEDVAEGAVCSIGRYLSVSEAGLKVTPIMEALK